MAQTGANVELCKSWDAEYINREADYRGYQDRGATLYPWHLFYHLWALMEWMETEIVGEKSLEGGWGLIWILKENIWEDKALDVRPKAKQRWEHVPFCRSTIDLSRLQQEPEALGNCPACHNGHARHIWMWLSAQKERLNHGVTW